MILSDDLIQEFAKLANEPNRDTSTDKTMYGTIVEYDNSKWVRIDGSDLLTPISSVTNVSDGDRVVVGIRNHSAIINGNLTAPSTTRQNVEDISNMVVGKILAEELEAEFAKIDILLSDYVKTETLEADYMKADTIESLYVKTEKLEADYIKADTIESTYVKTSRLESEFATIENLNATNIEVNSIKGTHAAFETTTTKNFTAVDAEIGSLKANKANVTELNAVKASIGVLDADMADINTLIFGSASGTTIQTSFANAVIAQLGDAQIKSAMIENISAGKITAGDIITNNVRVKSEDGSLLISDETIQISDDTRVRVQIGKDASNDYSINIWDADGKLMFSEGGITDSAIKDAIIRNDMVSANANISASKLDIDSLFTEINGSTNTIKSTKVYFDDKKQTLDVAFNSMTTTVSGMGETISSQGTQISTIQGQISNKIWQQDINTAKSELNGSINTLSTQYSTLNQTVNGLSATVAEHTTQIANKADNSTVTTVNNKVTSLEQNLNGFQTTVSSTYVTKTDFNNLDVGGRNLLVDTATDDSPVRCRDSSISLSQVTNWTNKNGVLTLECSSSSNEIYYRFCNPDASKLYCFEKGKTYTISGKAKITTKSGSLVALRTRSQNNISSAWQTNSQVDIATSDTTEWKYFKMWHPVTENTTGCYFSVQVWFSGSWTGTIQLTELQIEEGTVATAYGPAPEDMATAKQYKDLTTRVSQTESSVSTVAKKVTDNETAIAELKVTADGLTVSLNDAVEDIITAQSTADTAKTNAATAQSTADTAKANAATAQSTANTANTNATNAAKTATNFLSYDSTNGLLVGNKSSGSWVGNRAQITSSAFNILNSSGTSLASFGGTVTIGQSAGQNVYLDSDSVDIRKGTTVLASFTADQIDLGKNSKAAKVNLCGGVGTIYAHNYSGNTNFDTMAIESDKVDIIAPNVHIMTSNAWYTNAKEYSIMYIGSGNNTSGTHVGNYTFANLVSKSNATHGARAVIGAMSYADYSDASYVTIYAEGDHGSTQSEIYIEPSYIQISSPGDITLSSAYIRNMTTCNGALYVNSSATFYNGIELCHATPHIDFHFGKSTTDYTSRIIENSSGVLTVTGGLKVNGTLTATLSGNATSATTATQDGSGNTITSTYATKTELSQARSAASARGSASSLSIAANTITQLTLNTWVVRNDTGFTFSGGGIKCPRAGNVMVCGNIYFNASAVSDSHKGVYIYKNGTEVISSYLQLNTKGFSMTSGVAIISVAAGDVITLNARCTVANTVLPNNTATMLNVAYV